MQKVVRILYWQWTILLAAVFVLITSLPGNITGNTVLLYENVSPFIAPYDFFTNQNIIQLQHQQASNQTFHIDVNILTENSYIYSDIYYYTTTGWEVKKISSTNKWIKNVANTYIEDFYAIIPEEEHTFYVAAWVCKGIAKEWYCGCTNQTNCGYWHIQSINISQEGQTETACTDNDGDGYGQTIEPSCVYNETDCDDTDATINPGTTEIPYNAKNDDCNSETRDDDIDMDGILLINDCNDNNANIHPLGTEICDDSIDQDCDGTDKTCEQCGEGGILTTGCVCAGTSYHTGFCCDNSYQTIACGTPEVIFYDGFESGTANTWNYINPNSQINTDLANTGTHSLNLIYSNGNALKRNQYAETNLVEDNHLFYRYYLYIEEDFIQTAAGTQLNLFGNTNWPIIQQMRQWQGNSKKGRISILSEGEEEVTASIVENGQWYCIEEEIQTSDTQDIIRVWINEILIFEATDKQFSSGENINYLRQGGVYSASIEDTLHLYVDNVIVSKQQVGCN